MTAATEWIAKLVPEERRGEAMGWQGTAFTIGGAASSPIIGLAIDGVGAWGGFVVGGSIAAGIALICLAGQLIPTFHPTNFDEPSSMGTLTRWPSGPVCQVAEDRADGRVDPVQTPGGELEGPRTG